MDKEDEKQEELRRLWEERENASLHHNPRTDLIEEIAQQLVEGKRDSYAGLSPEERERVRIGADSPVIAAAEERAILEAADRRAREKSLSGSERQAQPEDKAPAQAPIPLQPFDKEAEAMVRRAQMDTLIREMGGAPHTSPDRTAQLMDSLHAAKHTGHASSAVPERRRPETDKDRPAQDSIAENATRQNASGPREPSPAQEHPAAELHDAMPERGGLIPSERTPNFYQALVAEQENAALVREPPVKGERAPNSYQEIKDQHQQVLATQAGLEEKSLFAEIAGKEQEAPQNVTSAAEPSDGSKTEAEYIRALRDTSAAFAQSLEDTVRGFLQEDTRALSLASELGHGIPSPDARSADGGPAAAQDKQPSLFELAGTKAKETGKQSPQSLDMNEAKDRSHEQTGPQLPGQLPQPGQSNQRSAKAEIAAQWKDNAAVITDHGHERASPLREALAKIGEVKVEKTGRGPNTGRDNGRDM
jgi:hypothetical protein